MACKGIECIVLIENEYIYIHLAYIKLLAYCVRSYRVMAKQSKTELRHCVLVPIFESEAVQFQCGV